MLLEVHKVARIVCDGGDCHPEPPELRRRSRSSGGRSKDPLPGNPAGRRCSNEASTWGVLRPSSATSASPTSLRRLRMTAPCYSCLPVLMLRYSIPLLLLFITCAV